MDQRSELMLQFGPYLIEAFGRILFEEINRIRTHVGMPAITWSDFFAEINNHLSELPEYDFPP